MKTIILPQNITQNELDALSAQADKILSSGGLIIFPTETVYGLACSSRVPGALDKIYSAKGRAFNKPVAVLVKSHTQISDIAQINHKNQSTVIQAFLPGPVTLILDKKPGALIDLAGDTVGIRFSTNDLVTKLVQAHKSPLYLTSANLSGKPETSDLKELQQQFQDSVDLIIFKPQENTDIQNNQASTVVSFSRTGELIVHRSGELTQKIVDLLKDF